MASRQEVSAWRPRVAGVVEVLHARFTEHAYPMHVHDAWTLLIVDDGAVRYDLHRREHGTPDDTVSLLPPHIPHNGSPATSRGFRKRVVYLDMTHLDERLIGRAVDTPDLVDPLLRRRVARLHTVLAHRGDELEAESRLALIGERLRMHLRPGPVAGSPAAGGAASGGAAFGGATSSGAAFGGRGVGHAASDGRPPGRGVARDLRDLLDARLVEGLGLAEAARLLHAHPTHLVRAFTAAFGIAPHQYVVSRRIDLARRFLLDGLPPGEVAPAAGFYDQPHLTRHFKRILGTTPARYASNPLCHGRR
ncbi:AraC family transcriptional regulator [Streptomyces sp. PR69]|uniref:AraC family transcriptional regulator n=1 Tax=Streptomyces sp. PR69 TaxID=2984950 RepID=UPI0022650D72|nr:AraC family transcriptional regulator [Streptomyces sp. PR69]